MDWMEERLNSIQNKTPGYIPVDVSILPATWMKYREALDGLIGKHPALFSKSKEPRNYDEVHGTYIAGEHTDAWGCVWSNVKTGMEAIVTKHPVATRESVHHLKAPEKDIGFPHGFMYLRLADLRGFEELMIDFAEEAPELQMLIDIVLEYNMRQAALRLKSVSGKPEIIYFGDDLGMQNGLAIHPDQWRKYLKPCYAEIYKLFRDAGQYVYMHTDGHILEIIPDLIECGVDIINPQVRANGIDNLVRVCKGKVFIELDLDRQLFPFGSPKDIDDHIREAVVKLGSRAGGLWLRAEISDDIPLENVEAIIIALEKYRNYYLDPVKR